MSPGGRRAYVSVGSDNPFSRTVDVLDTATDVVIATVRVGDGPTGLAVTPDGRRVYVTNAGTDSAPGRSVSVIDTATSTVRATLPVGAGPARVAVSPEGRRVYVSNYGPSGARGRSVSVIDTGTDRVIDTIATAGLDPLGVAVSPDGRALYVAQTPETGPGGLIEVINTATGASTSMPVPLTAGATQMALSADGTRLALVDNGSDDNPGRRLVVLDPTTTSQVGSTATAGRPVNVAITPDGSRAYVSSRDPDTVETVRLR